MKGVNKEMDEEQFLNKFLSEVDTAIMGFTQGAKDREIKDFLIEHHKNYGQVYWYKKEISMQEQIKDQVRSKLREFVDALPIPFDEDFIVAFIECYINERGY